LVVSVLGAEVDAEPDVDAVLVLAVEVMVWAFADKAKTSARLRKTKAFLIFICSNLE
jgi:hypothetical protein